MKKTDLKNEVIGCFLALFSTMCFTLGSVSVQALDGYIPDFELNVIRLSGPLVASAAILFWKKTSAAWPRGAYKKMLVFCSTSSWLTFTMYVAVEFIPIGSAGALYHGVMMITIPITARILLKEFISCIKWTSVAMCVAGSSLVVIGLFVSVDFSDAESVVVNATLVPDSTQHHQMTTTLDSFFFGIFICIASGLIEMVLVVVTKQMNDDVPNGVVLSLWNGIAGLVVSTVFMCCLELHKLTFPTDVENLLYLGGHTFCTAVACVTYFVALDYGSAIFCSIALNAEIPLRVLFEYVFATDIQPIDGNVLDVLGSVVVTLGVLLPAVIDLVKLKKVAAKDEEKTPILPG